MTSHEEPWRGPGSAVGRHDVEPAIAVDPRQAGAKGRPLIDVEVIASAEAEGASEA